MGASSSTEHATPDERDAENLVASTAGQSLTLLQAAFSILSHPHTHSIPPSSLQQCFSIDYEKVVGESTKTPAGFSELLKHIGPSVVELFFLAENGGISWIEFLRGYTKCCGRTSASNSFNTLCRVFAIAAEKAGLSTKLEFEMDDYECHMTGSLWSADLLKLLWVCWMMSWHYRDKNNSQQDTNYSLPDLNHIVLSAVMSCTDSSSNIDVRSCNVLELKGELSAEKIYTWALKTVPLLADIFRQFVQAKLQKYVLHQDNSNTCGPSVGGISSIECHTCLLTPGKAWAISLTLRSTCYEEIVKTCFPNNVCETDENLLYRSSLHGRGLNRFWAKVEGYEGPLLVLIAASSGEARQGSADVENWMVGALTNQGFENKDTFYGKSGSLYALSPVFHTFSASGKEKNFVYCHLHPAGRVYEPHPKPIGIGFGGSIEKKRIFLDQDFATNFEPPCI
ncbi:hypothetical protein AgCh_031264 [Apium graveolens]